MVLNCVISSSFQYLSNFCPLIPIVSVHQKQNPLFFLTPPNFFDFGVEMVVPPFSTLFTYSSREVFRDLSPLLGSILLNQVEDQTIFFLSPWTFDQIGIKDFLPSVKTLHIGSPRQLLCYLLPILTRMDLHCICQYFIFFFAPMSPTRMLGKRI